jgi:hypothetical protein
MHPDLSALCTHICLACKQLSLYNVRHMSCMLARLPNAFYNAHVQYTLLTTVVLTNVGADFLNLMVLFMYTFYLNNEIYSSE